MQGPTVVRNSLLRSLADVDQGLWRHIEMKEFKARFEPLNLAYLYFPAGASLALVSDTSGSDLAVLGSNDCSLYEQYPCTVHVRCPGYVYVVDRMHISRAALARWSATLQYRVVQWLEFRTMHRATQNIAQYLLLFDLDEIVITQQVIAQAIWSRRETVSEALLLFQEQGIIERTRKFLKIDRDALSEFARKGDFPSVIGDKVAVQETGS